MFFGDLEAEFNQMTPLFFTKVRNVKSPTRGTELSAGIDFYIPEFDDKMVSDVIDKNPALFSGPQIRWTQGILTPSLELPETKYPTGILLMPHERILIPSGIHVKIHHKFALIAHNKSGVASKKGLDVLANVVDEDYQGEVHLSLVNTSNTEPVGIISGDKILQFILIPVLYAKLQEIETLEGLYPLKTKRGADGFGSTGV